MFLAHPGDELRHDALRGGHGAIDTYRSAEFATIARALSIEPQPVFKDGARMPLEDRAGGSQRHAMMLSLEEDLAKLPLQPLDRSAQCGRAHVAVPGGAPEMKGMRELDELAQ
jgi:hypothetical protein